MAVRFFIAASVTTAFALMGGTLLAATAAALKEEPSILVSVTTSPSLQLQATFKASGLHADERMNLDAMAYRPDGSAVAIYNSLTGPDPTGVLSVPVTLALTEATYEKVFLRAYLVGNAPPDCNQAARGLSDGVTCAVVALPRPSTTPATPSPSPSPGATSTQP